MKQSTVQSAILTLFFILVYSLISSAQSDLEITAHFKNTPLTKVFSKLEEKYPLSFSYDNDLVRNIVIQAEFKKQPLISVLQTLLTEHGLGYELAGEQYILVKKIKQPSSPSKEASVHFTSFCGKVLNQDTGQPLLGAIVALKSNLGGAITNEEGAFKFSGKFSPKDTLFVSYLGYEMVKIPVPRPGNFPCRDVYLSLSIQWMKEVEVRDFATDMLNYDTLGNAAVFRPERIPILPGWGEPDVSRLLLLLPGVNNTDEGVGNLSVRGGTPDQNLILWDKIPIYHTGHFFGLYDAINPYVVQKVDFYGGNFSANYGGRTASVIDVAAKPQFNDGKWHGTAGFNLLHAYGFLEVPILRNKLQFMLAGRRSYSDLVQSETYRNLFNQVFQNGRVVSEREERVPKDTTVSWQPNFFYFDINAKCLWNINKKHQASASLYQGKDQLDYYYRYSDDSYFFASRDRLSTENFGISTQYSGAWSSKLKADYSAAVSRYQNRYSYLYSWDRTQPKEYLHLQYNRLEDITVKLNHTYQFSKKNTLAFGYQFSRYAHQVRFRDIVFADLEADSHYRDSTTSGLHTLFAEAKINFKPGWLLQLGMRENYYQIHHKFYQEPRLLIQWAPEKTPWRFQASFGKYYQFLFQSLQWNSIGVGAPFWQASSNQIPAQQTWQGALGFQYDKPTLYIRVEGYLKKLTGLTSLTLKLNPEQEDPYTFDGTSKAKGIDFLLRKTWHPYSFWLSYSLGKVTQRFPGLNFDQPFSAQHDVRHTLNVVNMYAYKNFDFSLNLNYRSGKPFTSPDTIYQVECSECVDGVTEKLGYQKLNTYRLQEIIRLDMAINWKWRHPSWEARIGFSIYNLLNRINILDKDFVLDLPPINQPQIGSLREIKRRAAGLTPNLVMQIRF
jgi:hypothetical protein